MPAPYPRSARPRSIDAVLSFWLNELESLEAISQDADTRRIVLRMCSLSRSGRVTGFVDELVQDAELDEATKRYVTELACDRAFLLAVEDYLVRTQRVH